MGGHQLPPAGQQQPDVHGRIIEADLSQVVAMPARKRRRSCVVLIGLVRGPTQGADPGRQGRRHVHDVLPSRDQPDRDEPTQTVRALHRPTAVIEPARPVQQLGDLLSIGHHMQLVERLAAIIDRDSRVCPLVRIDPDRHRHGSTPGRGR